MPELLNLPNELLERILGLVTAPSTAEEMTKHDWDTASTMPNYRVRDKIINLSACKRLHSLALDAHFIHNELTATIISEVRVGITTTGEPCNMLANVVGSGSFEQHHDIFTLNTRKLAIEIRGMTLHGAAWKIDTIAKDCVSLTDLTVYENSKGANDQKKFREKLSSRIKAVNDGREKKIKLTIISTHGKKH